MWINKAPCGALHQMEDSLSCPSFPLSLSVLPSSPPLLFQPLREPRGVKRPTFLLVAQGGGRRAVKYEPARSWFLFYTTLQEKNYHHFIWRSERLHSPVSNRQGWFPKANACTVIENSLPSQLLLQVKLCKLEGSIASFKPSIQEAEDLLREFWAFQGYIVTICLKTKTN